MKGSRLYGVAGSAFATLMIGCGSTSSAASQSGASTASSASTPSPAQTATPLTAQITFSGALTGMLALNPVESQCQVLPSGLLSAAFDGVVPGTEAEFNILEAPGTHSLVAGDQVGVDTNLLFWHSDTSGTITITIVGKTATGMATAVIAGQRGSGVSGTVADLHVSATFSCPVQGATS